ncbi:hypothetical protein EBU58_14100 [bacterium]|nr:hypothetical protein [bacterium]
MARVRALELAVVSHLVEEEPAVEPHAGVGLEVADRTDRRNHVPHGLDRVEAVEQLPAEAREVFDLVWYMGASQETAASVVGCSTRTIKTRWREARIAIKRALDDQHPDH